ncbi:MAG: glycoside hydrolase family 99-like domain-containing protein [Saprospirales bacterium]|nr:glycoside hydrolase family 99-like domain-containing protein [Saprospirales bacterium]
MTTSIRPIAIHLPQFHPIPENDRWWGKGFTEWTNVSKGWPYFKGHYQPHLPADLGFYDLRLHEALQAQAELASHYGIYGFCFYHYWFSGELLLERPVETMLQRRTPNFPFCLCWANENWTRSWNGRNGEILIGQKHSLEDDIKHFRYLLNFFEDPRYIKVNGRPLFIIYKADLFPNIRQTIDTWRKEAYKCGIGDLYLARMESNSFAATPEELGLDANIEFQPNWKKLPKRLKDSWANRFLHQANIKESPFLKNRIFLYGDFVNEILREIAPSYKRFPGIFLCGITHPGEKTNPLRFSMTQPLKFTEIGWSTLLKPFLPFRKKKTLSF